MSCPLSKAILLVDGYNIIGAWSCLKRTRDVAGLEPARWELIEALTSYSTFENYQTKIVFDAHYQNTSSHQEVITGNLLVYYTNFGQTADTYIEKACATLRTDINQSTISRVIVATSDRAQQLMIQGYGAEWISAHQLCCLVRDSLCRIKRKSKAHKQSKARFLANSIDPKSKQRLTELRMQLK